MERSEEKAAAEEEEFWREDNEAVGHQLVHHELAIFSHREWDGI